MGAPPLSSGLIQATGYFFTGVTRTMERAFLLLFITLLFNLLYNAGKALITKELISVKLVLISG